MFDNVGGKLKSLAVISTVLGMVVSVLAGFGLIGLMSLSAIYGIFVMAIGCLDSWLGSLAVFAIGESAENSEEMRKELRALKESNDNISKKLRELASVTAGAAAASAAAPVAQAAAPVSEPAARPAKKAEPKPEEPKRDTKKIPVPVSKTSSGNVICPVCSQVQRPDAVFCENCGQAFMNDKKVPYWCGKCGKAGPFYGDKCPDCGSTFMLNNQ